MITLKAITRDVFGKKVKTLRREGLIPAELYGRGRTNLHLAVASKDFRDVYKKAGENTVVVLESEKQGGNKNVLVSDVQQNPLSGEFTHVDFYEVRMDEKITVMVPVHFTGEAPAVKEKEGILVKAMQEIEVEALPADLPGAIEVSLESLADIGSSIHVKDIKISDRVKLLIDEETVIATVVQPVAEEVPAGPANVEEVKVEGEEKRKEKKGKETPESASE